MNHTSFDDPALWPIVPAPKNRHCLICGDQSGRSLYCSEECADVDYQRQEEF